MYKYLIFVLSLFGSLLISNFVFTNFYLRNIDVTYDSSSSFMIYDEILGYKVMPNITFSHDGITYKTDEHSERVISGLQIDPSKPNVLILGDSHVWGWGKRDSNTIQSFLSQMLQNYNFITISNFSYSSVQTYLKFLKRVKQINNISAIIWINGHNDSYNNTNVFEHRVSRPAISIENNTTCFINMPPKRPLYFSRNHWANMSMFQDKFTLLFDLNFELLDFLKNMVDDYRNIGTNEKLCKNETINGDETLIELNKLVFNYSKEIGAKFLTVLLPNKDLFPMNKNHNSIFSKEFSKLKIPYLDINILIQDEVEIFEQDDHVTPKIHNLIASKIVYFLN